MLSEKKYIFKVVLIGDYAVGKTSLITRYMESIFSIDYKPTLGYNIMKKDIRKPEKNLIASLNFWDLAGQEMFKPLHEMFFDSANGLMMVYDVTRPETFENIPTWHSNFIEKGKFENPSEIPVVLMGNKIDLDRRVSKDQGKKRAKEMGCYFIETSALFNQNVTEAFEYLLDRLIPK